MPFTAINEIGETIYPEPGLKGFCKGCGQPMTAKCGRVVTWHFAHDKNKDCQYGGETKEHLRWKKLFHDAGAEIEYQLERGRADIFCPHSKAVVEVCITNPANKEGILYKQRQYQGHPLFLLITAKTKGIGSYGVKTWEDETGWRFKMSARAAWGKAKTDNHARVIYERGDGILLKLDLNNAQYKEYYVTDGSGKIRQRPDGYGGWEDMTEAYKIGSAEIIPMEAFISVLTGQDYATV